MDTLELGYINSCKGAIMYNDDKGFRHIMNPIEMVRYNMTGNRYLEDILSKTNIVFEFKPNLYTS